MAKTKPRGGTRTGKPNLTAPELAVIDRYARALGNGKYRSTSEAAPDCWRALRKLRARMPSLPLWPEHRLRCVLARRARKLGLAWTVSFWSPAEKRLARKYARAVIRGRFPSLRAAARECRRQLAEKLDRKRNLDGVCWHISRELRALGVPAQEQKWTAAELRVLKRFTRKAYAGRPCTISNMSVACSRALDGRRSPDAVRTQMKKLVAEIKQPRFHGFSLPWERQYFERYALKAAAGKPRTKMAAARACLKALESRQKVESRKAPGRVSPGYKRDLTGVYSGIGQAARRLGLPLLARSYWNEEENRMCRTWREWYRRWRGVRRLSPLKQAAEGLQFELAEKGYTRTFAACSCRISKPGPME